MGGERRGRRGGGEASRWPELLRARAGAGSRRCVGGAMHAPHPTPTPRTRPPPISRPCAPPAARRVPHRGAPAATVQGFAGAAARQTRRPRRRWAGSRARPPPRPTQLTRAAANRRQQYDYSESEEAKHVGLGGEGEEERRGETKNEREECRARSPQKSPPLRHQPALAAVGGSARTRTRLLHAREALDGVPVRREHGGGGSVGG